jgi:murein DD-endopeptidase MepM/ murein hydrolase activator NlpD
VADQTTRSARLRVLLITVVALAAFGAFLWVRGKRGGFGNDTIYFGKIDQAKRSDLQSPQTASRPATSPALSPVQPVGPAIPTPAQTPVPLNAEETPPLENNRGAAKNAILAGSFVGTLNLIIPVVGVRPDQLLDTFTDARSEGRVHDAIDIPAPAGTPVVAAADGEIIKLFQSERGGTTIYQLSNDKKLVFYYAHLQRYADGQVAGKFVKQGEVIAYVGDTGNAGAGNFQLHFSVSVIADPKRYWEGTNINPYPLLRK